MSGPDAGSTGPASWGPDSLRGHVETACQHATGQLLNAEHGHGLPPLVWRVVTEPSGWIRSLLGQVPADDAPAEAALIAWAERHHLAPAADSVPGTGEVHGHIAGLPVQIWGVTDRATFEHETTQTGGKS